VSKTIVLFADGTWNGPCEPDHDDKTSPSTKTFLSLGGADEPGSTLVTRREKMATLTTVGGVQITFKPSSVEVLADHDASTGAAVTCVYGVGKEMLKIDETVPQFLKRVGIAAGFAQLTRPNGSPVWISGASVSSLFAPGPGEYVAGVKTVVVTGALTQGVQEAPAAATAALNAHDGNL
jgi:hypothetical protein